jgi:ribonuclease P protein component
LLSGGDFQQVFKHTECRSVDQRLTVLARQNKLNHARLGLAISKRIIKTAVGRNRVKRLVRESFRHHQQLLMGLDIVVMSRNGAAQASNPELLAALQTHWQRVAKKCAKA